MVQSKLGKEKKNKVVKSNSEAISPAESLPILSGSVLLRPLAMGIKKCCAILIRDGAPLAKALQKPQV